MRLIVRNEALRTRGEPTKPLSGDEKVEGGTARTPNTPSSAALFLADTGLGGGASVVVINCDRKPNAALV